MIVNIALLTVTDTRTFDNDKSGKILVDKIKNAKQYVLGFIIISIIVTVIIIMKQIQ